MTDISIQRLQDINPSGSVEEAYKAVAENGSLMSRFVLKERERDSKFELSPRFAPADVSIVRGERPAPLPGVELAFLKDARVFRKSGILTADNKAFFDWIYLHQNHFSPVAGETQKELQPALWGMEALPDGRARVVRDLSVDVTIKEPSLLIGTPGDEAYSHFVWDTLPMLWYRRLLTRQRPKVVIDQGLPAYKRELLTAVGVKPEDIVERDIKKTYKFETLIVPGRLSVNNFLIRDEGLETLQSISPTFDGSPPPEGAERIFVDRGGDRANVRRLKNEAMLWSILEPLGFVRVSPGLMSLEEKRQTFGAAKYVVGQYGGGMQNHFLSPPRTKILLLQSSSFAREIHEFTATRLQHDVVSVFGAADSNSNNSGFYIDPELFARVLLGRFLG